MDFLKRSKEAQEKALNAEKDQDDDPLKLHYQNISGYKLDIYKLTNVKHEELDRDAFNNKVNDWLEYLKTVPDNILDVPIVDLLVLEVQKRIKRYSK